MTQNLPEGDTPHPDDPELHADLDGDDGLDWDDDDGTPVPDDQVEVPEP